MRITLDASPQELIDEAEIVRAHLEELLSGHLSLSKGVMATIKPHPVKAVNQITEVWLRAYRESMTKMSDDAEKLLLGFVTSEEAAHGPA